MMLRFEREKGREASEMLALQPGIYIEWYPVLQRVISGGRQDGTPSLYRSVVNIEESPRETVYRTSSILLITLSMCTLERGCRMPIPARISRHKTLNGVVTFLLSLTPPLATLAFVWMNTKNTPSILLLQSRRSL